MQALVVYCHPVEASYCASLRDAAVRGLERAGHDVSVVDLTKDGFNPVTVSYTHLTLPTKA